MFKDVINWLASDGAISILIAFTITQIINVVIGTFKSVLTIKGTKISAAFVNGLSYAVNALVIKKITGISNEFIVIVLTFITNFIGVYVSLWIMDKIKKDKLWVITAVINENDSTIFEVDLIGASLKFSKLNYTGDTRAYMVFSNNKEQSAEFNKIIKKYDDVHYTVTTNTWVFQ